MTRSLALCSSCSFTCAADCFPVRASVDDDDAIVGPPLPFAREAAARLGSGRRAIGGWDGAVSVSDAEAVEVDDLMRGRTLGVGKFDFLSIASTVLRKRMKSASARMRVDGRSMVFESSLTISCQHIILLSA